MRFTVRRDFSIARFKLGIEVLLLSGAVLLGLDLRVKAQVGCTVLEFSCLGVVSDQVLPLINCGASADVTASYFSFLMLP